LLAPSGANVAFPAPAIQLTEEAELKLREPLNWLGAGLPSERWRAAEVKFSPRASAQFQAANG